jgi:hypothetical protein
MDVFTSVAVSQDLDFVVKLRLVLIQSDALPAALSQAKQSCGLWTPQPPSHMHAQLQLTGWAFFAI